jgi:Protein of unknown function (DUF1571)
MDGFGTRTSWLLILALAASVVGCAGERGTSWPFPGSRKEAEHLPPPQAAAALMISDPPPVLVVVNEPGKLSPPDAPAAADTTPVSFQSEVPSAIPAPEVRKPEPKQADAATTLPALVARPASSQESVQGDLVTLRALARKVNERNVQLDNYVMRLRRREFVNGVNKPEEIILCKIRRTPFSVYMKWLGSEAKGREVTYVQGKYDNKLHTLLAEKDSFLMPAGKVMSFAVDSMLIKSNSRYTINNAGLGNLIERFNQLLDMNEKGDFRYGTLKYLGQIKRPEFEQKLETVLHVIPPKSDPLFPNGGKRLCFVDPELNLPVLVVAVDERDREVEYYCHDYFLIPGQLDDSDFDPAQWNSKKR